MVTKLSASSSSQSVYSTSSVQSKIEISYEYSQIDIANLLAVYLGKETTQKEASGSFFSFYQLESKTVFPPVFSQTTRAQSRSAEQFLNERFDEFQKNSSLKNTEVYVPFNSAGHWALLKFSFGEKDVAFAYVDSLSNEKAEVTNARDDYLSFLEKEIHKITKNLGFELKMTQGPSGKMSGIEVNSPYELTDEKSCGPIVIKTLSEMLFEPSFSAVTKRLDVLDLQAIRKEQYTALKNNGFELDTDSSSKKDTSSRSQHSSSSSSSLAIASSSLSGLTQKLEALSLQADRKEQSAHVTNNNLKSDNDPSSKSGILPVDQTSALSSKYDQNHTPLEKKMESTIAAKSLLISHLLDEDSYPSGESVFKGIPTTITIPKGKTIDEVLKEGVEVTIDPADLPRLQKKQLEMFQKHPAAALDFMDSTNLPPLLELHFRNDALKKIKESGEEELQRIAQQIDEDAKKNPKSSDSEDTSVVYTKYEKIKKSAKKIGKEYKANIGNWNRNLINFYRICFIFANKRSAKFRKVFFKFLENLIKDNPTSMEPFYPILTYTFMHLQEKDLKTILGMAVKCNPYLTYALMLHFVKNYTKIYTKEKSTRLLEILKGFYPEDLFINGFLKTLKTNAHDVNVDLSFVSSSLKRSCENLLNGNSDSAIEILVKCKPFLTCESVLFRYLAFAWSLNGDAEKAKELLERSKIFSLIETQSSSKVTKIIQKVQETFHEASGSSSSISNVSADREKEEDILSLDPLAVLIKMNSEKAINEKLATLFVKSATDKLLLKMENLEFSGDLVFVYLGLKTLSSKLVVKKDVDFKSNPLFEALFKLLGFSKEIGFRFPEIDPWFGKYFKRVKKVGGPNYVAFTGDGESKEAADNESDDYTDVVHLEGMSFNPKYKEAVPDFEFSLKNLSLTPESSRSVITDLAKKTYQLIVGLLFSNFTESLEEQELPFPEDSGLFITMLQGGFSKNTSSIPYKAALNLLKNYVKLPIDNKPYLIDQGVLDWASFCHSVKTSDGIAVSGLYAELNVRPSGFDQSLKKLKGILHDFMNPGLNKDIAELYLRDVFLAQKNLVKRSIGDQKHLLPSDKDSFYAHFTASKDLHGWRENESFEEWGARLETEYNHGFFASEFNQLKALNEDFSNSQRTAEIEIGTSSKNSIKILKAFLNFWREFFKITQEKNNIIAGGGSGEEEDGEKKWSSDVDRKTWEAIVKENNLKAYPKFKQLPASAQKALTKMVAEKHEHQKAIANLKNLYKKHSSDQADSIAVLSSVLLVTCDYDRTKAQHSIYVESKEMAERVYRLLLEVAINRYIEKMIVDGGISKWVLSSEEDVKSLLMPLQELIGKFHGPEEHLENGPLHMHYNAHVFNADGALINTHIFYDEKKVKGSSIKV